MSAQMSRQTGFNFDHNLAVKQMQDSLNGTGLELLIRESCAIVTTYPVTDEKGRPYFNVEISRDLKPLSNGEFFAVVKVKINQTSFSFRNMRVKPVIFVQLNVNDFNAEQVILFVATLDKKQFENLKTREDKNGHTIVDFRLTGEFAKIVTAYQKAIQLVNLINGEITPNAPAIPTLDVEVKAINDSKRITEVQRQAAIAPENFPALPRGTERVINFAVRNTSPVASVSASASASLPRLVSARPASPYSNATRSVSPSAAHAVQNATNVSSLVTPLATPLDTPVIDEEGTHEATTIEAVLEKGLEVIGKNIAELRASIVDSNDTIRNIEAKISPIVNDNKAINASIALLTEQKLPGGESSIATLKASIEKNEALLNLFALDNSETFQKLQVKEKRLALYEKINAEHIAHIEALRVINYAAPTGSSWAENEN